MIAVFRSLGARSADSAESLEDFRMHFDGRCNAVIRSHMPITRDAAFDIETLFRDTFMAEGLEDSRVRAGGAEILVDHSLADPLTILIYELVVNAIKFGAIGDDQGGIDLRWWVESADLQNHLVIEWRERMLGHAPGPPRREGFGLTYLRRGFPYETGGASRVDFTLHGLNVRLAVPVESFEADNRARRIGWRAADAR